MDTDRWEERVQEAEQRKAVRTFAHILYVYCVCDTAKPTVMGGQQVCNQACRPCNDGGVTVTTQ